MAFTYPLTMPAVPGFVSSSFGMDFNNITNRSLNRTSQVIRRAGDVAVYSFKLPPMLRQQAVYWQAFGMKLQGSFGTFYAGDPDAKYPRGLATGTPLVKGASQVGTALLTDGWTASQSPILKVGDWIAIAYRLFMVVDDANSDGSGNATLNISPPINAGESPADNAAIVVRNPVGIFRLTTNTFNWEADHISRYGLSFTAVQQ